MLFFEEKKKEKNDFINLNLSRSAMYTAVPELPMASGHES